MKVWDLSKNEKHIHSDLKKNVLKNINIYGNDTFLGDGALWIVTNLVL